MAEEEEDCTGADIECSTGRMLKHIINTIPINAKWDIVNIQDATIKDFAYSDDILYEKNKIGGVIINKSEKGTFILLSFAKE